MVPNFFLAKKRAKVGLGAHLSGTRSRHKRRRTSHQARQLWSSPVSTHLSEDFSGFGVRQATKVDISIRGTSDHTYDAPRLGYGLFSRSRISVSCRVYASLQQQDRLRFRSTSSLSLSLSLSLS